MATPEYDATRDEQQVTQRELLEDSERIFAGLKQGRRYLITLAGDPVGRLVPMDEPRPRMVIDRPATRVGGWEDLGFEPVKAGPPLQEVLDEIRADRL